MPCHSIFAKGHDLSQHEGGKGSWLDQRAKRTDDVNPDLADAEKQFRFLMTKHDMAEPVIGSTTFGEVLEDWLLHLEKIHDADRFRLCKARINDFLTFLGKDMKVRDLRPRHVEEWIKSQKDVKKRRHPPAVVGDDPCLPEWGRVRQGAADRQQSASRQDRPARRRLAWG